MISHRFHQLCQQGQQMDYEEFRRGLGLLGREDSFICRIFNLIDSDSDGFITEANYTDYLRVILKGSELEKSRFGWLILTEGRGDIEFADFMELFQEISVVWNALTGEIVTPRRRYIEELFNTFDVDQDQVITFNEYPFPHPATASSSTNTSSSSAGSSTSTGSRSTSRAPRPRCRS